MTEEDTDDLRAYLSDFFNAWAHAAKEEQEAAELYMSEREYLLRTNSYHHGRW